MINPWREMSKVNPQVGKGHRHRQIATDCFQALIIAPVSGAVCRTEVLPVKLMLEIKKVAEALD